MSRVSPASVDASTTPELFAVVPVAVLKDTALTDAAVRLYGVLDGRLTSHNSMRLRQDTLADDLGWSRRKVQRATDELKAAGLLQASRTSRSSRLALVNPARGRYAATGDASDLTPQDVRCVNSDAADASDLTPPQINTLLGVKSNNNDDEVQPSRLSAPASPVDGYRTAEYIEAINEAAGVNLKATKTLQPTIGAIKARGLSPADTAALVVAFLVVSGDGIHSPDGYIAGTVLPDIAAGNEPTETKPTPTPATVAERSTWTPCEHGEPRGSVACALCRAASTAEQIKGIFAEVVPAAVFDWHHTDPEDNSEEVTFNYYGAVIWCHLDKYGGKRIRNIGASSSEGEYTPAGGDSETPYVFNIWEWKHRVSQRYSRTEARHDRTMDDHLILDYVKPIDLAELAADLKWVVQQLDEITQPSSNTWEQVASVIPAGWQIKPNGNVAEVVQHGETIAHISVKDSTDQWSNITGMTLFTDYGHSTPEREKWVLAATRNCFQGHLNKWKWATVTPAAVNGELVIAIDPTRNCGLDSDNMFQVFQALVRINDEIARSDHEGKHYGHVIKDMLVQSSPQLAAELTDLMASAIRVTTDVTNVVDLPRAIEKLTEVLAEYPGTSPVEVIFTHEGKSYVKVLDDVRAHASVSLYGELRALFGSMCLA